MTAYFSCVECGNVKPVTNGSTTGYGVDADGSKVCFACCGIRDARSMRQTGRATLYLTDNDSRVTNWPGSLVINVRRAHKGRHNVAGTRTDVWFPFDGNVWHGVSYGEWTQLVHCRRTREVTWEDLPMKPSKDGAK